MRKRLLILFLTIVSAVCLCIGISACGNSSDSSVNGTYYKYSNGSYDYSSYFVLKNGDWSDDSGSSGTYTVSGTTIVFYTELFGENVEFVDGTISDGVLTYYIVNTAYTYCIDGKTPSGDTESGGSGGGSVSSQYTVTYDANGGTFAYDEETYTQTVSANSTLTAPTSPTREGYSFAGWATSKNGSTMWSFSSDKVTADITLYASWTEKSASILSVDNATIDGSEILLVVDRYTESVSLSSIVVCSSNSSWKLYYDKLGQMEIPTKIAASSSGELNSGDNVFYIVVTSSDGTQVNLYTLTVHRSYAVNILYYNGSSLLKTEIAYTGYTFDADYEPSITGYTFNYWKTTSSGSTKYTAATLWGNLSLYASITAKTYTVTYDVNGGDELTETTASVTYDSSYTLTVPTRTNYTFNGWYSGNTQLTNSKGVSLSVWNYSSDKTLTAKWTGNSYSVTLYRSDGFAGTVTGNGNYSYTSSVTITATTNDGYTWIGWYDENDELVTTELSYTFEMPAENVTYMAKWIETTVTVVSSDTSIGTVSGLTTTNNILGNSVTVTATEVNLGYNFLGWYSNETKLTDEYSYTFTITENDTTYTAKYELDPAMSNFAFTSTTTACAITGINDSTVTKIVIPNYVTSISSNVFSGCTSLESVTYSGTASQWAGISFGNEYANPLCYAGKLYLNDSLATEITVEDVTTINNYAFYNCTSLTSVTIGESVTSIGSKSFNNCTALTKIIIGDGITSLSSGLLYGCSSLVSITLPFVGGSTSATSASSSTLFGYIFGTSSYNGGTATKQYYGGYETYYIPTTLKTVTVTGGNILYGAFYSCSNLKNITIIGNVTSIGGSAFYNCTSLESIDIPNNVTSIGDYAFWECISLTSVYYSGTASQWASISFGDTTANPLYYAGSLYLSGTLATDITLEGITTINNYAFSGCTSLTSITIPDSVTSIGSGAFEDCTSLITITIPNSVTSIGGSAFYNCTSLTSATIPDGVTFIYQYAFYNCTSLTSVTIGESVTSIGSRAFWDCTSLTSIVIPNSVTSIGEYTFYHCVSLTSVTIGSGMTSIDDKAFIYCYKLVEIYNLSSLTITAGAGSTDNGYVGYYAKNIYTSESGSSYLTTQDNYIFYNDSGIYYLMGYTGSDTALTLPTYTVGGEAVNYSIYRYAFCENTKITSVSLGNNVTAIDYAAFWGCISLTNVTIIGSGVTSIGGYAFYNCTSLTSVTIGNGVTSIGDRAFVGCCKLVEVYNLSSLSITAGSTDNGYVGYYALYVYTSANTESCLLSYDDYTFYCDDDGNYYLLRYNGSETELTLPTLVINGETVNYSIYKWAFAYCTSLESVTIGDSVETIGDYAFYNCTSLTSITIPDSVTSIGIQAFLDCTSLTSVTIGDSVTSIGDRAFYECTSLKKVTIGDSVTSIGKYAFYYCSSLTSVTFTNTSNWYRTTTSGATSGTSVSSTTIANASTMATYLTSTYYNYYWYRSES